jgi:hypothetical protein
MLAAADAPGRSAVSEETLNRIAGWCDPESDLELSGSTITVAGDPPVLVEAGISDDALTLTHVHRVSDPHSGFADRAVELLAERGSMVTGEVVSGTEGTEIHVRYPIYLEGLNRQSFLVAVREVTGTVDRLRRLEGAAASPAAKPSPPPSEPGPEPEPKPAAATAPAPRPAANVPWAPTHQVPAAGMAAWSEPNPALSPVAQLAPGVQLRIDEQRGAWAKVTGSNGWTGWVDARILQPVGSVAVPAARPTARAASVTGTPELPALIGGIMMVASAFLAWGHWSLSTGMDVPFFRLWPLSEISTLWTWTQPRVGLIMIIVGAVAVLAALLPAIPGGLRVLAGLIGILTGAGALMAVIVYGSAGDIADHRLTGVFVAIVGGIVALVPRSARR